LYGQNLPCGADLAHHKAMQQNPVYRAAQEVWEQRYLARIGEAAARPAGLPVYTLPVVVHVIHQNGLENIPDAQILAGMQHLNESFANTGYYDQNNGVSTPFQFCLARRKPDGSATTGIDRVVSTLTNMTMETEDLALKDLSRWDPTSYINIWLVAEITSQSAGAGVAGYAFFPAAHGGNTDGLVFEARWFGSSQGNTTVATHEMGHYLGLYHTFEGSCVNNDCAVDGDRVCDTPPDASTANLPCGANVNTCTTDAQSGFTSDQPDMIVNYMDYSSLQCFNAFTQGQSTRMESALLDVRSSLLDSKACIDPCPIPFAVAFTASAHSIAAGSTVNFTNTSLNGVSWSWQIEGIPFSAAQDASYTFNSLGGFAMSLHGVGADPNCEATFFDTILVTCPLVAAFTISDDTPTAGANFTLSSTSVAATTFEWTINGVLSGTNEVQNASLSTTGIYTVCLTAGNGLCDRQVCQTIQVVTASPCFQPPCTEICDNGIDDDADGFIDCYDTYDCPCTDVPDCSITEFNDKDFGARLAWRSPANIVNAVGAPMVANLNPNADSIAEIVVPRYAGGASNQLLIFKGDGSNANSPSVLTIQSGLSYYPGPVPCIADVNNDGIPELMIVCNDLKIRVYTNYNPAANPVMTLMATSNGDVDQYDYHVYTADFDSDGIPELYAGNDVFTFDFSVPGNPQLNLVGNGPAGPVGLISSFFASYNASSVAVDLLTPAQCGGDPDCNGLEIAAGYAIYSVDLSTTDGDPVQIKIQKNLNVLAPGHNFRDGYTVFADIDLNGIPEVIVSGSADNKRGVYAWNRTGFFTFFPNQNDNQYSTGVVAVANVFDDKTQGFLIDYPELISTNSYGLNCFNYHAAQTTPALPFWWSLPTTDYSGYTGVTTFDFNGDKILEIVYRDEQRLRIMYGGPAPYPTGVDSIRNWDIFDAYSITADEYPVVANVDADDQAEIVFTGNPLAGASSTYSGRLYVLESDELYHDPWLSARNVWNQYNYFVTNINDDLSVPKVQQVSWLEMPLLGSGKRPLNNFLFQVPKYDENFDPYLSLSDATIKVLDASCFGSPYKVQLRICNEGANSLKPNTPVTFYGNGNPFSSAATKIGTYAINTLPLAIDSCLDITLNLPPFTGKLYAVVNDPGVFPPPFAGDSAFYVAECDYFNNMDTLIFDKASPALALGPDIVVCQNGVFTINAGSQYTTYKWQDGSTDSTFTAWLPGKYWVEVTDVCNNVRSDTLEVKWDPAGLFDLGPDRDFCGAASLNFSLNGFSDYQWFPEVNNGLSCNNCPDPVAEPADDITYTLVAKTPLGCYSVDSIRVFVHDTSFQTIKTTLCEGESFSFNGEQIPAGSDKAFGYFTGYGCDSTILVQVTALPKSQTTALLDLCFGETASVFGQAVGATGIFSAHFLNANGCDSLHTINVHVFPPVQNTAESPQICPGDSILVFGSFVKTAGIYPGQFADANGCDSTHTISVAVFPQPLNTAESRQLCPGDSTLVFGSFVKTGGLFAGHFPNINGCDSVHTVSVAVFPQPQNTAESRPLCPGDSTLVFGSFVKTGGLFAGHFPNVNGCDSVHTISVAVFPQPQNTVESRQLCPGDSTLVFGSFVKIGGVYPGHFPNVNGCDSVHTISVALFPQPQNTAESRQICPGDSTLVFGSFVKTGGVYAAFFPNINGCDSVHTISVALFPQPQNTAESRQICPGDSTFVFGSFVTSAGVFQGGFLNINGCDSTHTVSVALFPQPQNTTENRNICLGDSTLVFGSFVKTGGLYTGQFSNINGCDSIHAVNVAVFPAVVNTAEEKAVCAGDSALVFGAWIGQAGAYQKHFPNINGCDSTHTIQLKVNPLPTPVLIIVAPGCDETTGALTIQNPAADYLFSFDGIPFQPGTNYPGLWPGSYLLTTRDALGCETAGTFTIPPPPPTHFISDSLRVCAGDSILVFGQWIKQAGQFSQTFANQFDCDSVVLHTVQVLPQAAISLMVEQPTCIDPTGILTLQNSSPGATFCLDGVHFSDKMEFAGLLPGDYRVYVRSDEGCVRSELFKVAPVVMPGLQLPGDTMVEMGQSVLIIPSITPPNNYVYEWIPNLYLDCAGCRKPLSTPLENIEYVLVITDAAGCTATDRMQIRVSIPDIYVPNVFSPNDDAENDAFTVYTSATGVRRIVDLQVFDRWGNLIFQRSDFQPNDESLGWRGDFRGSPMNPAVFAWWAEVEFVNGQRVLLKGDVTLLR